MYDLVNGGARQASTAKVTQGCIESSNINVVSEMVNMINDIESLSGWTEGDQRCG